MEAGQFSAFSATVMAGLRELLKLRPDAVMDRRKPKEVRNIKMFFAVKDTKKVVRLFFD